MLKARDENKLLEKVDKLQAEIAKEKAFMNEYKEFLGKKGCGSVQKNYCSYLNRYQYHIKQRDDLMNEVFYVRGQSYYTYRVFNNMRMAFQFEQVEAFTQADAYKQFKDLIGNDARKWRFEIKKFYHKKE